MKRKCGKSRSRVGSAGSHPSMARAATRKGGSSTGGIGSHASFAAIALRSMKGKK